MENKREAPLHSLVWGAVLVVVGILIMMGNAGYGVWSLWRYSPLILVVTGLTKIIQPDKDDARISGTTTVLWGLWLLGNFLGAFGMGFGTSWPFILIIIGIEIVWRSLIGRSSRRAESREALNGQQ